VACYQAKMAEMRGRAEWCTKLEATRRCGGGHIWIRFQIKTRRRYATMDSIPAYIRGPQLSTYRDFGLICFLWVLA